MRAQISSAEPKRLSIRLAEPPYALRAGATLGRWRLDEPLARGGSAHVWRAVDALGRRAALKWPLSGHFGALRAEHAVLAAISHPNVVRTIELLESGGRSQALVLELVDGGDLVSLLGAPPRHWLPALHGTIAAVAHLHERRIAHRDLKARNVLLATDGTPRLVDLASAGAVDALSGSRGGTTAAHRPARGAATGRETDTFALAGLVYELVTGRLPFGVEGRRSIDEPPVPWTKRPPAIEALMRVAVELLAADGRAPRGLSTLADVIESAAAAADE